MRKAWMQLSHLGDVTMKTTIIAAAVMALTGAAALAQGRSSELRAAHPQIGMGSKSMDSCTADQRKFCATAGAILKECLVKNWNHISSDCQDALGTPVDRIHPEARRE